MTTSRSEARLKTEFAARYMTQLCKHFEHRQKVAYTADHGRIEMRSGLCTLAVEPGILILRAEAADAESLARLQGAIISHLERFAFREKLEVQWEAQTG
jgi:hypothetical protein